MLTAGTPGGNWRADGRNPAVQQASFAATALNSGAATLQRAFLAAINHLLHSERWARDRLRPFAGQTMRFEFLAFSLTLGISPEGLLERKDTATSPAVLVRLPDNAPRLLVTDRAALFAKAQISGTAAFAENLSFVFKHLRWDAESDLATLFGDIAARRLVRGGQFFFNSQRESLQRLSHNVLDYLSLEAAILVQRREFDPWAAGIAAATLDAERLERRLRLLPDQS